MQTNVFKIEEVRYAVQDAEGGIYQTYETVTEANAYCKLAGLHRSRLFVWNKSERILKPNV